VSTHRISPKAGYVFPSQLPKGPNGRALCRECGAEVPKGRRTFCGDACVDDWSARHSPSVMRARVFKRDKGVCAACGTDTEALRRQVDEEARADRNPFGAHGRAMQRILGPLGYPPHRLSLWDADHIVAVVEGGGECGLDNIQALCIPCHHRKTAELARKRKFDRARERQIARARLQPELEFD
jgi:5-methylcytosine-specific restriction enzyme A